MAFEFKKGPEHSGNGLRNPFEDSGTASRQESGTGFSFGKAGGKLQEHSQPAGGFQFSGEKKKLQSGTGFSDVPAHSNSGGQRNRAPKRRSFSQHNGYRQQSNGLNEIPWRIIIYFLVIVAAVMLLITYWDTIVYVAYNLIAILIALVILLFLLRLLFSCRR